MRSRKRRSRRVDGFRMFAQPGFFKPRVFKRDSTIPPSVRSSWTLTFYFNCARHRIAFTLLWIENSNSKCIKHIPQLFNQVNGSSFPVCGPRRLPDAHEVPKHHVIVGCVFTLLHENGVVGSEECFEGSIVGVGCALADVVEQFHIWSQSA